MNAEQTHNNEAEYVNCIGGNVIVKAEGATTTPTSEITHLQLLSSSAAAANAQLGTTYVTISMLPPSTAGSSSNSSGSGSGSSTSTFKTPLLPMPTLEDIEDGVGLLTATTTNIPLTASATTTPIQQPIPGGILKYPNSGSGSNNSSSNIASKSINLSLLSGMGPGPPPPPSMLVTPTAMTNLPLSLPPPMQPMQTPLGNAPPPPPLPSAIAAVMLPTPTAPATTTATATTIVGILSCGTTTTTTATTTTTGTGVNPSNCNLNNAPLRSNNNGNNNNSSNKRKSTFQCCACFGSSSSASSSSATGTSSTATKAHKHKHKTQSLWSALLTNLGICALLLAYTLLGSFIFLTIESEDSSSLLAHQQRTLASTKRTGGSTSGRSDINSAAGFGFTNTAIGSGGGGAGGSTAGVGDIYHAQSPVQHLDNGTVSSAVASSSSYRPSVYSSAVSSSASSSSSSSLAPSTLSGMVEGAVDAIGYNNNNNNHNNNNDFIYGDVDVDGDENAPELALLPDTYDVRQRTIENIWDITVSLNILYKENWTKLAALEIAKFQDQLIKRLNEDALLHLTHDIDGAAVSGSGGVGNGNSPATEAVLLHTHHSYGSHGMHEWNFAKAFLYSLTVLTTIGYGNIAPRTTLGRLVTLAYAIFGIPLTLVYLSSTGGILAKVAREVFSKALCCCLCSNCGYCCYDERRMAEKERRTKRKRQQDELRKQQASMQEPYYVRSGTIHDTYASNEKQATMTATSTSTSMGQIPDMDSLSASESRGSMHGLSILAPILLCLCMMIIYIMFGAVVLYRLENWPILDGIYFCFMSLSTIGFGDMLPGLRRESTTTTWFCSIYIMSGMALTAMCFNVIHEEIVHRIKIVVEFKKGNTLDTTNDDAGYFMTP